MIRICFYNYGGGELHVSRELEINQEVDEYLIRHIPGLQLEATDSEADMDDNSIYYFSGKNEAEACGLAKELINSRIRRRSEMKYTIEIVDGLSAVLKAGYSDLLLYRYLRLTVKKWCGRRTVLCFYKVLFERET